MNQAIKSVCIGTSECSAIAFNSNAKKIAAAFNNGEVILTDLVDGHEIFRNYDIGWVVAMDWLPGDLALACLTQDGEIKVVNPTTGTVEKAFDAHDYDGRCLKRLGAGGTDQPQMVATGGGDGYLNIWDITGAQQVADINQGDDVTGIHISPDGTAMLVALAGGEATHWNLTNQKDAMTFLDSCYVAENWIQLWSPDAQRFVTASGRNKVGCSIWTRTGILVAELDTDVPISAVAWSPDGLQILYAHGERISIADASTFTLLHQLVYPRPNPELTTMEIRFAWWSKSNCVLASYGNKLSSEIRVWDLDFPDQSNSIHLPNCLCCLVTSSYGSNIALGDEAGSIYIVTDDDEINKQQDLSKGIFIQIGVPVLIDALLLAKDKDWRWFSSEPRAQRFLEEERYDHKQANVVSLPMVECNMGIISKGMMKGIYLFDYGRDLAYRWVNAPNVTPIGVHRHMDNDVAISYSKDDLDDVKQMKDTFERQGLKVFWIDVESDPNDPIWELRFMDGVMTAYYFVPLISENYFKRYGSVAEYIECSKMVMTYWDSTFLNPMIAVHLGGKATLDHVFENADVADIQIGDENADKISIAQQLPDIFGFSGDTDLERCAKFLKSCVANSRAKSIVDLGFLDCMPGPIEWYRLNGDCEGKRSCDLLVRSHMQKGIYFRFFMYSNNIRYIGTQEPLFDNAISFSDSSISEILIFLGIRIYE